MPAKLSFLCGRAPPLKFRPTLLRHLSLKHTPRTRRHASSQPPRVPSAPSPAPSPTKTPLSRLAALNARLPRLVQRWTTPLLRAPVSQMMSFLILHEATAVIPLFGLVGAMHYANWTPPFAESAWVLAGVERFGRYARRRGWLVDREVMEAEEQAREMETEDGSNKEEEKKKNGKGWWGRGSGVVKGAWNKRDSLYKGGETGVRLLIEFGTAWAVVKALLIPRLILSAWATPWFARLAVEPVMRVVASRGGKLVGGTKKTP